eukprot:56110-Eustigmatos_ZCMA.PRE.1
MDVPAGESTSQGVQAGNTEAPALWDTRHQGLRQEGPHRLPQRAPASKERVDKQQGLEVEGGRKR